MIIEASGNLLRSDADALVNTVNTVGVMGKGIALQFRRAYPEMFASYAAAARAGDVSIGRMHVWETGSLTGPRFIINFPTKRHWRAPSRLADIDAGLKDLVGVVRDRHIGSIAIPPLGCGNGGLRWSEVEPIIRAAFEPLPDVTVHLFAPSGAPKAAEMPSGGSHKPLTRGRAALIDTLARYQVRALAVSPVEVQKLMYFLQAAGEPLRLDFVKGHYGPYADNLRHVLQTLEGQYLTGYGDGSAPVLSAEPIEPLPGAADAARRELEKAAETKQRIDRVLDLADGFESMYGMELLGSVHWIGANENLEPLPSVTGIAASVSAWTARKGRLFTTEHIDAAYETLRDKRWLPH